MGMELDQRSEWAHEGSLDWDSADEGLMRCIADLNALYREGLHVGDLDPTATYWSGMDDADNSVMSFVRGDYVIVCNFTPVARESYRVGVPTDGDWTEVFNSDRLEYGGSDVVNSPRPSEPMPWNGLERSIQMRLPPLAVVVLRR